MTPEQQRLMALHDGELDASAEAALEAELAQPRNRAELRRLALIGELVREAEAARAVPPDLADEILARTIGTAPRRPARDRKPAWQRFAAAGAGVLALAAMLALVVTRRAEPQAPAAVEARRMEMPAPSVAVAVAPSEPEGSGVSIQSVDFGSTQGAIFLVSGAESETMVVWTLEDTNDKG